MSLHGQCHRGSMEEAWWSLPMYVQGQTTPSTYFISFLLMPTRFFFPLLVTDLSLLSLLPVPSLCISDCPGSWMLQAYTPSYILMYHESKQRVEECLPTLSSNAYVSAILVIFGTIQLIFIWRYNHSSRWKALPDLRRTKFRVCISTKDFV